MIRNFATFQTRPVGPVRVDGGNDGFVGAFFQWSLCFVRRQIADEDRGACSHRIGDRL